MRIDKYLADMSFGSRNDIKKFIREKRVKVDGKIINSGSFQVKDDSVVCFDDDIVEYVNFEYYLLNKPAGYLSAVDDYKDPVVMDLISSIRKDLFPVGRLDKDTEGLLLITNDGQLNHQLLSKDNHVPKKYYVKSDTIINPRAQEIFSQSIHFKEFDSLPAIYQQIDDYSAYLTITEGKYHQVKRMFEHIGNKVIYLKRVEFAFLNLDGLMIGQYRPLTYEEIEKLKEL